MNKILLSLLAGIAIGVLIAPDKGSETLRKIRSRINDYTDHAEDEVSSGLDGLDDLADDAKSAIKKGKRKVNESFQ